MSLRVDTLGWDIAVGIPLPIANAALARSAHKLITGFDFSGEDAGQAYRLQGSFGAWSVLGGAGELIDLALPIVAGTFSLAAGGPLPAASHALDGAVVRLRTRLRFAEPEPGSGAVSLMFSFDEQSPGQAPAQGMSASILGGPRLALETAAILPQAVAACLAHHFDAVRFVFATLTPHATLPMPVRPAGAHSAYLAHCPADAPGALVVLWAADRQDPATGAALPCPAPLVPEALLIDPDRITVALSAELAVGQILRTALALGLARVQDGERPSVPPTIFDCEIDRDGTGRLRATQPIDVVLDTDGKPLELRINAMALETSNDLVSLGYHVSFARLPILSGTVTQTYLARVGRHSLPGFLAPGLTLEPTAQTISQGASKEPISLADLLHRAGALGEAFTRAAQLPERLKHAFDLVPVPLGLTLFDDASLVPQGGYLNGGILFQGTAALPATDTDATPPSA